MVLDWIKFIKKLDDKKQDIIFEVIQKIISGNINQLDIKPILGKKGYFRCRIGNLKLFILIENTKIFIKKGVCFSG
ncbi:MAG: hypothetical protein Q9M97_02155 [Candidatus Gracilibacteria bacterium]|nr:hypothetical protein [Candidatus Gracilibacteria bacterium]